MLDTKIPRARDIPYEDWDHFLTLLAIKYVFEHRHGNKITLAQASAVFACMDEVIKDKLTAFAIMGEERQHD
jgi:hypothetical protein